MVYLSSCELGFRCGSMAVFQIQLARRQTAVPLIRDYIARSEHRDAEARLLRATASR